MKLRYHLAILLIAAWIDDLTAVADMEYYKILELENDVEAPEKVIKRQYRKLALKMHPDKNPNDPEAQDKFHKLTEAYEVLSDPKMREQYNRFGKSGLKDRGGFDAQDTFSSFFGDFDFFGFGGESHGKRNRDTPRGADVVMTLWVTLEELYSGNFVEIVRNKPVYKKTSGTRKCNCRQEMLTKQLGPGRFQMMQQTICDECPNQFITIEERNLEVEVEPGMKDGQEQKFVSEGEPHIDGEPGDLRVKIATQPHTVFERRGDDLYTNITISLTDALTGFEMSLKHLDGHEVKIRRDKITWPGAKMRKADEGMPNYENNKKFGTLFITFDIDFPKGEFTEEQKKLFKEILNEPNKTKSYNGLHGY